MVGYAFPPVFGSAKFVGVVEAVPPPLDVSSHAASGGVPAGLWAADMAFAATVNVNRVRVYDFIRTASCKK